MRSIALGSGPSETAGVQEQEPPLLFDTIQVPIVRLEVLLYHVRILIKGNVESCFALKCPTVEILDGESSLPGTWASDYENALSLWEASSQKLVKPFDSCRDSIQRYSIAE